MSLSRLFSFSLVVSSVSSAFIHFVLLNHFGKKNMNLLCNTFIIFFALNQVSPMDENFLQWSVLRKKNLPSNGRKELEHMDEYKNKIREKKEGEKLGLVSLGILVETTFPCSLLLEIFGHVGFIHVRPWVAVKLPLVSPRRKIFWFKHNSPKLSLKWTFLHASSCVQTDLGKPNNSVSGLPIFFCKK